MMESFAHGDKLSFELRPTTIYDLQRNRVVKIVLQHEYDTIMRYMLHPAFRDWISDAVSESNMAEYGPFNRCFGFRADMVKPLSERTAAAGEPPELGVVVIGTLYVKDDAEEAAASMIIPSEYYPKKMRTLFKEAWKRVCSRHDKEARLTKEKKKRTAQARQRVKLLATYDEACSDIQLSLYDASIDKESQPTILGLDAPLLLFEFDDENTHVTNMKPLSRMRLTDSRLEPFERDVLRQDILKRLTSPTGLLTRAARSWKAVLTNPHHPKGQAFLYAQFLQMPPTPNDS